MQKPRCALCYAPRGMMKNAAGCPYSSAPSPLISPLQASNLELVINAETARMLG
jgi:hypothetical protein